MSAIQDMRQAYQNVARLRELDEKLVSALLQPAIDDEYMLESSLRWQDPSCTDKAFSFTKAILELSEFYRAANPVMSAALWGIWNSVDYFERQHGLLWILFLSGRRRRQRKYFSHYRGLVATAACHFADGTPTTTVTSDAWANIDNYEDLVNRAIEQLRVCGLTRQKTATQIAPQ